LRKENLEEGKRGEEMRALFKLRCGNLEEGNKYWIEEHRKKCIIYLYLYLKVYIYSVAREKII